MIGKIIPIFDSSNSVFDGLYQEILDIIRENKIALNEKLIELIEDLDQAGYGIGLDLQNIYIQKKIS